MKKVYKFIFADWSKWKDVSCNESMGYIIIIQTRAEIRKTKLFVNDHYGYSKIQKIYLNEK